MLKSFTQADRDDMVENGVISVTCEFCSETYVFDPDKVLDAGIRPGSLINARDQLRNCLNH